MIHLIIPMSGQGTRYQKAGYTVPKPAIMINQEEMLSRLLTCFPQTWPSVFVMAENHRETSLPSLVSRCRPQGKQAFIPPHTMGPLPAIEKALDSIPKDQPVLVSYCDYGMIWDANAFERFVESTRCDACLISYRGFQPHYSSPTMYAYSKMEGERVVQVKEKGAFTDQRENEYASCGAYYFRTADILRQALQFQTQHQLKLNGEYYTSLTVQALLEMNPQADVRIFEIPAFFQWGTPEDLWNFEYWEKTFKNFNLNQRRPLQPVSQVLMPMAGRGSRFQHMTSLPKPMIPIDGRPMYQWALSSLPPGKHHLVGLEGFPLTADEKTQVLLLKETPEGQALSTQAGCQMMQFDQDVLVSSCDHSIVLDANLWSEFMKDPQCDAAIFTVKHFPGSIRKPKDYTYVRTDASKNSFAKINHVSVKSPLTDHPRTEPLLVGTFWFRQVSVMNDMIDQLKRENRRVNGELYLDSVFQMMIEAGLTVREIPLSGYINWGDPNSLNEAAYWFEVFCGRKISVRDRYF